MGVEETEIRYQLLKINIGMTYPQQAYFITAILSEDAMKLPGKHIVDIAFEYLAVFVHLCFTNSSALSYLPDLEAP